jgi:hypothetical protein
VRADRPHQGAEDGADLDATRPLGRAQQRSDEAALAIEHDHGLKAVLVVMRVEQAQLLRPVRGIKGVVDVEHDAPRHLPERAAVEIDESMAHAQQGAGVGPVLQA